MKKQLLIIVYCIGSLSGVMAQQITGKVVDEKQNPMAYVSVVLKSLPDSTAVAGVASKPDGSFELPAKNGVQYVIMTSYLGYQTVSRSCRTGNVGTIVMKERTELLDEVVVIAQRTKHEANGYMINLRSSDIAKGKPSSDALMFLPGVSKESGVLKINGLAVSEIYVDGVKLTNFDELNNIPADMIDKVKVNYLAGSNQNASMTGGTIDISLRQPPKSGYYGSLSAGADYGPIYGFSNEDIGGVIKYRYKNLSVYDNLSIAWNQNKETATQSIWNQSTNLLTQIYEDSKYTGFNINNRLSLTQQINKRNKIGASYYVSTNRQHPLSTTVTGDKDALKSAIAEQNNVLVQEATVNYSSTLNDKGMLLEVIGDYFNRQANYNSRYSYGSDLQSTSAYESSLALWKMSIDMTHPQSQKLSWKYGASVQLISSEYNPENTTRENDRFSTSLIPTRTRGLMPHAYAQAMGVLGKLNYSIGVNWQLNQIEYKALDKPNEKFSNTKWGINPTLQLMMPLDKKGKHAIMLNYKHQLDDIPYAAISSTVRWSDPYNYTVGNPNLTAPTSDIIMAGVSLFSNKLNLTALYTRVNNNIYWETLQSSTASDVFYTTPINLPAITGFGVGAELNLNPVKPWTMKLSARLEIFPEDITIAGVYYGETRLRQYYSMYNTFDFTSEWGAMLNIIFEPTYKTYDRTYHTVYNIGGKIYKSVCDDKLQLSLIFNALGDRRRYDRFANGNKITYNYTTPVQSIGLSLLWRFSGGKKVKVNAMEGSQDYKEVTDIR